MRTYDVTSRDGTVIQAWTNDADGPPVLLCNGLGVGISVWPWMAGDDYPYQVHSWFHRGVGGSQRPADRHAVGIDQVIEDAIAVLDDAGLDRCVVAGWSFGVSVACELALRHPERVSAILGVAGVPGGIFGSVGAPLLIPRPLRRPLATGAVWVLRRSGRLATPLVRLGWALPGSSFLLRHSGFMLPEAEAAFTRQVVGEFIQTDVAWYFHLARHMGRHQRLPVEKITVPTEFLVGKFDLLTSARDLQRAAARMPDARVEVLSTSHFLPLERPDAIELALEQLMQRVESG